MPNVSQALRQPTCSVQVSSIVGQGDMIADELMWVLLNAGYIFKKEGRGYLGMSGISILSFKQEKTFALKGRWLGLGRDDLIRWKLIEGAEKCLKHCLKINASVKCWKCQLDIYIICMKTWQRFQTLDLWMHFQANPILSFRIENS